jgi:hypothetical protein
MVLKLDRRRRRHILWHILWHIRWVLLIRSSIHKRGRVVSWGDGCARVKSGRVVSPQTLLLLASVPHNSVDK